MNPKEWVIIGLIILVSIILYGVSIDYEKTQCISNGGKWISGMVAGELSYFCIPQYFKRYLK